MSESNQNWSWKKQKGSFCWQTIKVCNSGIWIVSLMQNTQNSQNSQLDAEQLGGNQDQWRAKVCEKRWQRFYRCLWKSLKNTLDGIEHLAHALENKHLWLCLIIDFKLEMVTNTDVLRLIIAIVSLTNPTGSNFYIFLFSKCM